VTRERGGKKREGGTQAGRYPAWDLIRPFPTTMQNISLPLAAVAEIFAFKVT